MTSVNEFPLESLLSPRQLVSAKIYGESVFFISNLSGRYSLYSMSKKGSIPIPLIPEGIALQNPHLMNGENYSVFPSLKKIIVMIDDNGNELYQPHTIPITGGIPHSLFESEYEGMQVNLFYGDPTSNFVYFGIDNRNEPGMELISFNLESHEKHSYGKTKHGKYLCGISSDHNKIAYQEGYGFGDNCLYLMDKKSTDEILLFGIPLEQRNGQEIVKSRMGNTFFVENDNELVFTSILNSDRGSFNWLSLSNPSNIKQVETRGIKLPSNGELEDLFQIERNQFYAVFNVNGASFIFEAYYEVESDKRYFDITKEIVGSNTILNNGLELSIHYDEIKAKSEGKAKEFIISFTKATMPSQLFLANIEEDKFIQLSNEQILGIPQEYLSEGEDFIFTSFDGLKISARLYMPSEKLGFKTPRPLVVYVHGGPQSQERPDFTWFSMPLIQYFTLNGFAVFVPNVRGSTGYGFEYMQKVERDWGGDDIKDHITALEILEKDNRIDSSKRAVMGRSYGGFMTLSLVSRYPDKWQAGCDMFGPYDLFGFYNRLPPSWQVGFDEVLGNPVKDREFYIERSPKTYINDIKAPLLIIQGANDPRVTLEESKEIADTLQSQEKKVELLVFDDEGHDVIKFANKITCYNRIVDFFKENLV